MIDSDRQVLERFAARMHEICDEMGLPAERGRQSDLARLFGVTPKSARKWLGGVNFPELPTAVRIADWASVNVTWLLQGVEPKRGSRVDTKALVLDEAVRSLPPALGTDLIDNLRAKLQRVGKLSALSVREPQARYETMLEAYEQEISRKSH